MKNILPICMALAITPSFAETGMQGVYKNTNSGMSAEIFIGGNFGITGIAWSDDAKDGVEYAFGAELPDATWGLGAELGVRIGNPNKIYNFGFTGAYDYMFNAEAEISDSYNREYYDTYSGLVPSSDIFSKIDTGFSAFSLTFDNYIRVIKGYNTRSDIVAGIGLGNATERVKIRIFDGTTMDYDDDDMVVVLKAGYNWGIMEKLDVAFMGRWFIPTKSDSDVDATFTLSAGIKYKF